MSLNCRALLCCVALVLSCDLEAHHKDLGGHPCCAEICASDLQHKRGRQRRGVRRAADATHRLTAVIHPGLYCDVVLV